VASLLGKPSALTPKPVNTLAHPTPALETERRGQAKNRLQSNDQAAHGWYRFVLSFPPHLVREYAAKFVLGPRDLVLDPFCGTGTTLVECCKLGIPSIGIEANPVAHFVSKVKIEWRLDPDELWRHANGIARAAERRLAADGIEDNDDLPLFHLRKKAKLESLTPEKQKLLLKDSISPLPLHKTLALLEHIESSDESPYAAHEKLALASALLCGISNLHFGPEVGVGSPKPDAAVIPIWLESVRRIRDDLRLLRGFQEVPATVIQADSRRLAEHIASNSVSAVITSPPYPNEKDYTRTTRLESVLLGFIKSKSDLRALKGNLVRSNTRGVFRGDSDDQFAETFERVQTIARAIEKRRIKLHKTSGFERLYPRVTKLYFGGMVRHLADLRRVLRRGAQLAYVVGDQASYLRIMIRTGEILADIARSLGYEVTGIDLFRTRLATATREQLREEVVLLRWPG
jgi:DNA modification methylase